MNEHNPITVLYLSLLLIVVTVSSFSPPALSNSPVVHQVTMDSPDIIRVEVREAAILSGRITKLKRSVVPDSNGWAQLPDGQWGVVLGPGRDHFRIPDVSNTEPLDRNLIAQIGAYGLIGSRRVKAVYRKSVPWSSGRTYTGSVVSFVHFVYLQLDADLSPGKYEIRWPEEMLPPTVFDFRDTHTRASSIRTNQLGHGPNDTSKYAYLSLWLPNGPNNGAVDFSRYGLDTFQVVNRDGNVVFTGSISLRTSPLDPEHGNGFAQPLLTYTKEDGSTYTANRSGTYVFGLDYSGWRAPPPGIYSLRVPGLGVSDSFEVAKDIWFRAAQIAMAGLYHQRSGLALDGRFGYSRPEGFTEKAGITIYQSKLPFALSSEAGGFIPFSDGAKSPWLSELVVKNAWGGYQDAGDWDRRVQHLRASYFLLDVFEQLPPERRQMNFNLPESSSVLPHPAYVGRRLPDIVDEAIWNIDFYRRLQRPDGAVPGGIESSSGPKTWEPSWLESNTVFIYEADPRSTFAYAAAAAKLSIVLTSLGETKLAELFSISAQNAWNWADLIQRGPLGGYKEAVSLLGMDDKVAKQKLEVVLRVQADYRLWAAATLFRHTGRREFKDIVEERFSSWVDMQGPRADAGWEYLNAIQGGRDVDTLEHIRRETIRLVDEFILAPQSNHSYRTLKHIFAPMMWGEGLAPTLTEIAALIRSHRLTGGRKRYFSAMLDVSAHILGANQIGMSFTTGLGRRWPKAPLHEDSIAAGIPAPHGITIYGWADPVATNYSWLWGPSWAALSEKVPTRRVEPIRTSLPIYEYVIEHPRLIMTSEYTIHQSIATTAAMWIYLSSFQ